MAAISACNILQSENIFDFNHSFRVVIVGKPLTGDLVSLPEETSATTGTEISTAGPSEYLSHSPMLENDFFEKIERLRRAYILCPGYESHLAVSIKELSLTTANQLVRYLPSSAPSFELVYADIERVAFATLHSRIFPHLSTSGGENSVLKKNCSVGDDFVRLELVLKEMQAPGDVIVNLKTIIPFINGIVVPELLKFNKAITPQQKVNYLVFVVEKLSSIFKETGIPAVTADHLLAGMVLAIVFAQMNSGHIHAAHVSMFLCAHPELSMEKGSFAFATFNTCIEFLSKAVLP